MLSIPSILSLVMQFNPIVVSLGLNLSLLKCSTSDVLGAKYKTNKTTFKIATSKFHLMIVLHT